MINLILSTKSTPKLSTEESSVQFEHDIIKGLSAKEKRLDSKYFYDTQGDALFQKIMQSEDYYLTDCEMEILRDQKVQIADALLQYHQSFDLIELGAGDATKSIHLLEELLSRQVTFTYYPVDISSNVINQLQSSLPKRLPTLSIQGLNGEYFDMLDHFSESKQPKVVLFMGANIGNIEPEGALAFINVLKEKLNPGDLLFVGFDLKKDPHIILKAYNDTIGYTKAFNLNLLKRINETLQANFIPDNFAHYPTYDPHTGSCKSYLISRINQEVFLPHSNTHLSFQAGEPIYMEISQKYDLDGIERLAHQSAFKITNHFFDQKKWFVDSLWLKP